MSGFVPVEGNWNLGMNNDCGCTTRRTTAQQCPAAPRETACAEQPAARQSTATAVPAMVTIDMQRLGEFYEPQAALKAGTLYPELHKPMNGYHPCGGLCADEKQRIAFTLWELRLYLDTHPDDQEAFALLRQLCTALGPNYATTFLPDDCANGWTWTNAPWPWEYAANRCE